MGGVCHKAPLLLPGFLHRADGPVGQGNADQQEYQQAKSPNEQKMLYQMGNGVQFVGDVPEYDPLAGGGGKTVVPQMIPLNNAGALRRGNGDGNQLPQTGFISQVIIAAVNGDNVPGVADIQKEIGEVYAAFPFPGAGGAHGIGGYVPEKIHAFPLQILRGADKHHHKNGGEHHHYDGHIDADKFDFQPFNHPGSPPDDIPACGWPRYEGWNRCWSAFSAGRKHRPPHDFHQRWNHIPKPWSAGFLWRYCGTGR